MIYTIIQQYTAKRALKSSVWVWTLSNWSEIRFCYRSLVLQHGTAIHSHICTITFATIFRTCTHTDVQMNTFVLDQLVAFACRLLLSKTAYLLRIHICVSKLTTIEALSFWTLFWVFSQLVWFLVVGDIAQNSGQKRQSLKFCREEQRNF